MTDADANCKMPDTTGIPPEFLLKAARPHGYIGDSGDGVPSWLKDDGKDVAEAVVGAARADLKSLSKLVGEIEQVVAVDAHSRGILINALAGGRTLELKDALAIVRGAQVSATTPATVAEPGAAEAPSRSRDRGPR